MTNLEHMLMRAKEERKTLSMLANDANRRGFTLLCSIYNASVNRLFAIIVLAEKQMKDRNYCNKHSCKEPCMKCFNDDWQKQ